VGRLRVGDEGVEAETAVDGSSEGESDDTGGSQDTTDTTGDGDGDAMAMAMATATPATATAIRWSRSQPAAPTPAR
jgi:hypothetical protein